MAAKMARQGLLNGGVGRAELFSLAVCLPLGGLVFSGWPVGYGGLKAWVAAVVCGVLVWAGLACFMRLFAGQSLGEALIYAFGNAFGRIVLFLYCLLWLALALGGAAYAALLWQALGLTGTPLWLYALLFLLTAALIAAAGEAALSRVALLVIVPSLVLLLGNLALTLIGADWGNLLPPEQAGRGALTNGLTGSMLSFGSLCILLPCFYQVKEVKNRTGTLFSALFSAALLILALAFGTRVALSASLPLYRFPLLQVFRLAEVGHWFSRFEVIGAGLLVVILLIRSAAALSAALAALQELWSFKQNGRLAFVIAAILAAGLWLLLLYAGRLFADWWAALVWLTGYLPYALLFGAVLLPWAAILAARFHLRADSRTVLIKHDADGR